MIQIAKGIPTANSLIKMPYLPIIMSNNWTDRFFLGKKSFLRFPSPSEEQKKKNRGLICKH